jgi:hypothetical protein
MSSEGSSSSGGKLAGIIVVVVLLFAVVILGPFWMFRDGGWLRKGGAKPVNPVSPVNEQGHSNIAIEMWDANGMSFHVCELTDRATATGTGAY